ncbi:recombinase family protein [Halorubrum vacuolatum]|uniref:Site-specific DNA recombinase n=1 Tax=Halorubrum vacuolatum TaxID=63740 RepID=A0A238YEV4_HALVU|nr:recombinase family protein [Halorubrum vacuolatum]SNR69113.1 Site-specific DNA recombinase [Halorubrum vacuolatum]
MSEDTPEAVGIYARVSTSDQDASRQLDELRTWVADQYPDAETEEYVEIVSGSATDRAEEYHALRNAISGGDLDLVVVDEISRLSRLGGGEVHGFIQHAIENDTSVRDREVGLSIDVGSSEVDQAVKQLIAGVLGDLAKIEHKQKLRRIRSGIAAAQDAGKWTGRPPAGFVVEDGYLRVDVAEYLHVREAVARVDRGEPYATVAEETGLAESTLRSLEADRRDLYLAAEAEDDRVDEALDGVRPLDDLRTDRGDLDQLRERIQRLEEAVGEESLPN